MSPSTAKFLIFAMDQVTTWTTAYQKAMSNPDMTEAQADQLIKDTQLEAESISDEWRDGRRGG